MGFTIREALLFHGEPDHLKVHSSGIYCFCVPGIYTLSIDIISFHFHKNVKSLVQVL